MSNELRSCATDCCQFVGDRKVNRDEYEQKFRVQFPSRAEVRMPCRWETGGILPAVEKAVGFYIGMRAGDVTFAPPDGSKPLYDAITDRHLREATDPDIENWNAATKEAAHLLRAKIMTSGNECLICFGMGVVDDEECHECGGSGKRPDSAPAQTAQSKKPKKPKKSKKPKKPTKK
jgi:hypothetical protein